MTRTTTDVLRDLPYSRNTTGKMGTTSGTCTLNRLSNTSPDIYHIHDIMSTGTTGKIQE